MVDSTAIYIVISLSVLIIGAMLLSNVLINSKIRFMILIVIGLGIGIHASIADAGVILRDLNLQNSETVHSFAWFALLLHIMEMFWFNRSKYH